MCAGVGAAGEEALEGREEGLRERVDGSGAERGRGCGGRVGSDEGGGGAGGRQALEVGAVLLPEPEEQGGAGESHSEDGEKGEGFFHGDGASGVEGGASEVSLKRRWLANLSDVVWGE